MIHAASKNLILTRVRSVSRITIFYFLLPLIWLWPDSLHAQFLTRDSTSIIAQKDLIDIAIQITHWETKEKSREEKKINFSFIPIAPSSGVKGTAAVSSFNAAFYMGSPSSTNLSNIYIIPYTNFSSQRGIIVRPYLWLADNQWNIPGEFRMATNNLNTYSVEGSASKATQSIVRFNHARVYASIHRLLIRYLYFGAGYNLDHFYKMEETLEQESESDFHAYGIGTTGTSTSSGLTFNILRDDRKNSINATNGFYNTLIYKFNTPALGSTYSWTSLYSDNRKYISFSKTRHQVLGIWAIYWGTFGDVPYFNLPGTSTDPYGRTGRGYFYGRFRGKQMLYAECEYRFDISADGFWGGVVFANGQSFTGLTTNKFEYIKPAAGVGLRVKFNKKSDMNLTLDAAFGKNSFNWYINLGEFF